MAKKKKKLAKTNFVKAWLEPQEIDDLPKNVTILRERDSQRGFAKAALQNAVKDHFVGIEIIESIGGLPKAVNVLRNALPTGKITCSGDFGEILATEYVDECTEYRVPIRRLRYKDDRGVAMRGDDVLRFRFEEKPPLILKTEAKSRVKLTPSVVSKASEGLRRHRGRPNPSTLSFISRRLRERNMHEQAEAVESLQEANISAETVEHLIFTLSGNNPSEILAAHHKTAFRGIRRRVVGCVVKDHAKFIKSVFDAVAKYSCS